MDERIIVVDVDLTVVRSDLYWLSWLNQQSDKYLTLEDCNYDYNLGKYFPEIKDPFEFWSGANLYDNIPPIEGSVESLRSLSEKGFTILFASYCKKGHFGSKADWCYKHFPFMSGFYATKEKQYIKADWFIDDRNNFLNLRDDDCKLIRYNTDYTQEETDRDDVKVLDDWIMIENCILMNTYF